MDEERRDRARDGLNPGWLGMRGTNETSRGSDSIPTVESPLMGPLSAKAKAKDTDDGGFPVTEPSVVATTPKFSIWNYRPGSLLFRRKPASTPPAMPMGDSAGSLSHYFPGLSGKSQGESLKLARAGQSAQPRAGSLLLGRSAMEPTGNRLARNDDAPISVLPVGLRVENTPKSPSPSLPEPVALAKQSEESKPIAPAPTVEEPVKPIAPNEQLTSLESDVPKPSATPDLIDGLSLDLQVEPHSAPQPEPAPRDPASQPASAIVEAPAQVPATTPPQAKAPAEVAPTRTSNPAADTPLAPLSSTARSVKAPVVAIVAPDLAIKPLLPPTPPMPMVRATFGTAAPAIKPSPATDPVFQGRPRLSRVEPMILPPADFPSTYHAQSISRVLKEEAPTDSETKQVAGSVKEPRRTYFPRLTKLLSPKAEVDRSVKPASNTVTKPASIKPSPSKPLALSEPGQVPEWWQGR